MAEYTEKMYDALFSVSDDDESTDNYYESMMAFLNNEENFRTFGEALTAFIGEVLPAETEKPIDIIKSRYKEKEIALPDNRTLKGWFEGKRRAGSREQVFSLAFALDLSVEQTKTLFHKVLLDRAFDFRNQKEIIFYYCLKNGKLWSEAQALIRQTDKIDTMPTDDTTIGTQFISTHVAAFNNDRELIAYIARHRHNLDLKNFSAKKELEKLIETAKKYALDEATETEHINGERELREQFKGNNTDSISFLYCVILDKSASGETGTETLFKREIKQKYPSGVFRCFPEVITLSGNNLSYEEMRKALILLFSYIYWYRCLQNRGKPRDIEDYTSQLNDLLAHSGMPVMYYGNPFDWLFLYCTFEEDPLNALRSILAFVLDEDEE